MSNLKEAIAEENVEFSWGCKKGIGGPKRDVQFYKSFSYDGVKYSLDDCVYMWEDDQHEPHIGKLVKIWETARGTKKVKVVWFFRPSEIQHWLGDVKPLKNEIFLASGEGKGLVNLNPLKAICGKCNVVCTSEDRRNPKASEGEMRTADYIFYRTFDVRICKISDKFADIIAGHEVEHYFNRRKERRNIVHLKLRGNLDQRMGKLNLSSQLETVSAVKEGWYGSRSNPVGKGSSQQAASLGRKTCSSEKSNTVMPRTCIDESGTLSCDRVSDVRPPKKRKLEGHFGESFKGVDIGSNASRTSDHGARQHEQHIKSDNQSSDVARRPFVDTSKWFKHQTWEERIQIAQEKGSLVLLENLDPSITSLELEDIVWNALNEIVRARMIPHCYAGQAFVIFRSKDAAENAISELTSKCLMLGDGRPVIGRRGALEGPDQSSSFVGHLKIKSHKQREDMRDGVSTAHYSQPNTIEYEMAIQWLALQEILNLSWAGLYEKQAIEIEELRAKLETNYNQ